MKKIIWNENWKFWNDDDSFKLIWNVPEDARVINLPHDAMIEKPAYPESPNGGSTGFRDGGNYIYYKTLTVDQEKKRYVLSFDGVYSNTFVYVNGQLAGKHFNGYTQFSVNLSPYLNFGQANEIRISVRNNATTNSRWYTGSGIYRDVSLLVSDHTYMEENSTHLKTISANEDYGILEFSGTLRNDKPERLTLKVQVNIKDTDGIIVGSREVPVVLFANDSQMFSMRIQVIKPECWSHVNPYLYTYECYLSEDKKTIYSEIDTFGIRTIEVDAIRGFQVNGESVNLKGACIHDDNGIIGAATYYDVKYRQVSILKDAGFNAIRMAHHTASKALLKACDKLGIYVMDETFDMWTRMKSDYDYGIVFDEAWEEDVRSMIRKNYNHPSVVLYSIGNEIPEIGLDSGMEIGRKIHTLIKSLDTTRYTLASINGVFACGDQIGTIVGDVVKDLKDAGVEVGNVNNFLTLMDAHLDRIVTHPIISERLDRAVSTTDIAGYNYMTARYELDGQRDPNRIIVGSETYPPEIARNWKCVEEMPHVIGDFTWTGWDYIGEAGVGVPAYEFGEGGFGAGFPCQLAYSGDIDLVGYRRPASYYREIVFGMRKEPFITVQNPLGYEKQLIKTPWVISDSIHSWSFPYHVNKPVIVEVYGQGDEVELLQDGISLGKKPLGETFSHTAYFEVDYKPGTIEAVNYMNGREIGRDRMTSANEDHHLYADIKPGIEDELIFIEVEIQDSIGELVTYRNLVLDLSSNDCEILGAGSGNPKPIHNYKEGKLELFHGRGLVIAKKSSDSLATIEVSGDIDPLIINF